jgi:hypothetical protein
MKFSVMMSAVVMMALAACASQNQSLQVLSASTPTSYATTGGDMQLCGATFKKPVIELPPPGTPPNVAAFLGQWGDGHQGWNGGTAGTMCSALFVISVTPDGSAKTIEAAGATREHPPQVRLRTLKIDGNYMQNQNNNFWRDGDELYGKTQYDTLYVHLITLPRVVQTQEVLGRR